MLDGLLMEKKKRKRVNLDPMVVMIAMIMMIIKVNQENFISMPCVKRIIDGEEKKKKGKPRLRCV